MSEPRVVAVVQARCSSTRLPGKVLKPLAGAPSIVRLIERVRTATTVTETVLATSVDPSDDALADVLSAAKIRCLRGSLHDVLARYVLAATEAKADVVVRVTGDCPLMEPRIIDDVVRLFLAERAHVDYASNVDERTFPDGLDVEVFSMRALLEAQEHAGPGFEREHVTPWLRRHKRKISWVQDPDLNHLRWTLDYPEDYENIAAIFAALHPANPSFHDDDVYRLLVKRPELIRVGDRRALGAEEQKHQVTLIERRLAVSQEQRR